MCKTRYAPHATIDTGPEHSTGLELYKNLTATGYTHAQPSSNERGRNKKWATTKCKNSPRLPSQT